MGNGASNDINNLTDAIRSLSANAADITGTIAQAGGAPGRRCTGASACKCCTGASGGPFSASATATCGTAAATSGESASRRARGHKVPSSVQLLWRGELLARGSVHQ